MMRHYCIALLSFLAIIPCNAMSVNLASGLGADGGEPSGQILELKPPGNRDQDVDVALAAIAKHEHEKQRLSDRDFEAAKQRLIVVEKQRLHDIVQNAFASTA